MKRRITSVRQLERAWAAYKAACDARTAGDGGDGDGKAAAKRTQSGVTYTIEGFCVFIELSRSSFYATYAQDERYRDTVERMREECEVDARTKFETRQIPTQLAGLWMSRHGYTTSARAGAAGGVSVVICGGDELED